MSDTVQVALIACIPGTITAVLAYLTHRRVEAVGAKVEVVRNDVNSKMTEMLKLKGEAAEAKGNLAGRAEAKAERKEEGESHAV